MPLRKSPLPFSQYVADTDATNVIVIVDNNVCALAQLLLPPRHATPRHTTRLQSLPPMMHFVAAAATTNDLLKVFEPELYI